MNAPTLRVLSLGASVQSTSLLLLAAEGRLPKLDAAIFADEFHRAKDSDVAYMRNVAPAQPGPTGGGAS
jgi:hypothetical protein